MNESSVNKDYSGKDPKCIGGIGELCNNNTQFHTQNRIYNSNGEVSTAVTTVCNPFYVVILDD